MCSGRIFVLSSVLPRQHRLRTPLSSLRSLHSLAPRSLPAPALSTMPRLSMHSMHLASRRTPRVASLQLSTPKRPLLRPLTLHHHQQAANHRRASSCTVCAPTSRARPHHQTHMDHTRNQSLVGTPHPPREAEIHTHGTHATRLALDTRHTGLLPRHSTMTTGRGGTGTRDATPGKRDTGKYV